MPQHPTGRAFTPAQPRLADELGARTITLPAISTGVYGYPIERATFVLFSVDSHEVFERAMADLGGRGPDA